LSSSSFPFDSYPPSTNLQVVPILGPVDVGDVTGYSPAIAHPGQVAGGVDIHTGIVRSHSNPLPIRTESAHSRQVIYYIGKCIKLSGPS